MENKSEKKNNKKIAIIVIIAVLLAAAVILCVLLPKSSPADPDESAAPTESVAPASPDNSKPGSTKPDTKPSASASPEASAAPAENAAPAQPGNTGSNQNTGSGSQATPGQSGGSTGNQSNTNTGNTQSGNQNSDSTEHQHSWQPVYKTVHHDEKGHYETVVVQAAWDEEKLRYTDVCNVCGYQGSNVADHIWDAHDGSGSYHNEGFPTGEYIHHEAVTEQRWVVDTPAYDEQVIAGYKCSCGQEKLA